MTKINKKFIEEMQSELDRKAPDYDGKDNPKNYKNMGVYELLDLIDGDVGYIGRTPSISKENFLKKLIAIANRCWMIWERLGRD